MKNELKDFSPEALCATVNKEWGLDVRHEEIIQPQQGADSCVVFVRDMVIKSLKCDDDTSSPAYRPDVRLERFHQEVQILRDVSGKDLGVNVPEILHVGQ